MFAHEPWKKYSKSNNCYAFALDDISVFPRFKLMPGPIWREVELSDCQDLVDRVLTDERFQARGVQKIDCNAQCKPGYYKI